MALVSSRPPAAGSRLATKGIAAPTTWSATGTTSGVVHVLHPGDVVLAEQGDRLETLLGSCVSIVLTDPRRTIGAMCHVVHATEPSHGGGTLETAHGEPALATMYALLISRGIFPTLCEAYVYGGGNMFPDLIRERHVGDANAAWALAALRRDRIQVLHHDLGGTAYRKVGWTVGVRDPLVTARLV